MQSAGTDPQASWTAGNAGSSQLRDRHPPVHLRQHFLSVHCRAVYSCSVVFRYRQSPLRGGCKRINVLQIVQAEDKITLQMLNLTALTFVTGSVLFAVASILYLWTVQSPVDQETIDTFLGWQYLVGSVLFLLGGVFNYWHAWLYIKRRISSGQA